MCLGAPEARMHELLTTTTAAVCRHVFTIMPQRHAHLFALLLSFERLASTQRRTPTELDIFQYGVASRDTVSSANRPGASCGGSDMEKPAWISDKV